MDATKRCPGCSTVKCAREFYKSAQSSDGLQSRCKDCNRTSARESQRRRREADPEGTKVRAAQWYAANRTHANAKNREWREKNAAHLTEYRRRWREENPEYGSRWVRENRERHRATTYLWRVAHPGKTKEYADRYRRSHPEALREEWRRKKARRKNVPTLLFSVDQLAQRWAYYGNKCWVCRAQATETDHVKPLAKGGWHMLANLRPICHDCNMRKRDHWPLNTVREVFI